MRKTFGWLALAAAVCGCHHEIDLGDGMVFGHYNGGLCDSGLFVGEGTEPVIPGGCDSAKWNHNYVLTKAPARRYSSNSVWNLDGLPPDSVIYFVVNKKRLRGPARAGPGPARPADARTSRRLGALDSGPVPQPRMRRRAAGGEPGAATGAGAAQRNSGRGLGWAGVLSAYI